MRIFFFILIGLWLNPALTAKDVITLNNNKKFEGKVVKLKNCSLVFKSNGSKFEIPADSIYSIQFDDYNNKLYKNYSSGSTSNENLCFQGQMDATNFHGKKGSHFALGVLFGPFAIIGTALADPNPYNSSNMMMTQSKDDSKFSDPMYLMCYKKKARTDLIVSESLGWLTWIILLVAAG